MAARSEARTDIREGQDARRPKAEHGTGWATGWDGNVPLHECVERAPDAVDEEFDQPAREEDSLAANERALKALLSGRRATAPPLTETAEQRQRAAAESGTADAPITWLFEPENFAPLAKLVNGETYSVVTDHVGTPTAMFDASGREVWGADIDTYGDLHSVRGERQACPFRWPGQYEDAETGLYYNRFRYYDPETGQYTSQDPSGIEGGRALYAYPLNPLTFVDLFGLNVSTGAGRDHVTYRGVKDGKPYTGYASAPSELGLKPDEIVARRYGDDFSAFGGRQPVVAYSGSGESGKEAARGLEQHYYQEDVKTHGQENVANRQNPVGPKNKKAAKYRAAAEAHLKGCKP